MARLSIRGILILLLGACLVPSMAIGNALPAVENADPQALFRAGVSAFENGDLDQARELLERADASGFESSALNYNLGVLYFRMQLYELSREHFNELLDTNHQDLARYNLGLVAQANGQPELARDYFAQVAEDASQQKLRTLARRQLEPTVEESQPWLGFASLGAGYESNLALLPDTAGTELSDSFNEIILAGQGPLWSLAGSDSRSRSVEASGSYYRRHFHSEDDFTNDAAQVSVAWVSRGDADTRSLALKQAYFRIADESREYQTSFEARYRELGCFGSGQSVRCDLDASVSRVFAFNGYEAYEGWRYGASAGLSSRWDAWRGIAELELEVNGREDLTVGEQFVSVSPRRQGLALTLEYLGFGVLTLGSEVAYRYSDYPDPYRLISGPDRESGRRADHRYSLGVTAEYLLSRSWSIIGEVSHQKSESSLKQYSYDNQSYQVSLDYLF